MLDPIVCRERCDKKLSRMSSKMNLQGLLTVLEDGETDLFARKETQFAPVPLTGVQLEVCQRINFLKHRFKLLTFFYNRFSGKAGGGTC